MSFTDQIASNDTIFVVTHIEPHSAQKIYRFFYTLCVVVIQSLCSLLYWPPIATGTNTKSDVITT